MQKTLSIILLSLILLSCNSKNTVTEKATVKNNCPKDGICSSDVLLDTELQIMTDEFDNSYYKLIKSMGKILLKYEFIRKENPQIADDSYSEIIFIQIDNLTTNLELEDASLSKAKVSFARMCFCREATGVYPVKKGKLKLNKFKNEFDLKLEFKIDEVPQVITSINETFKI